MIFYNGVEYLSSPTIQGIVDPGTGLTMPAFIAGGHITLADGTRICSAVNDDFFIFYGGTIVSGKGAILQLAGADGTGTGQVAILTPNAAKTSDITRMRITGDVGTAAVNWTYVTHTGIVLSGNLTCAGAETIDGRDLSVDGTKLDTIETSADVNYTEGARVYNNAAIEIPNNDWTILPFNSERYDTDTIHSTVADTSHLTCVTAGKYIISFTGYFDAHATGNRYYNIYLNGTTEIATSGHGLGADTVARTTVSTIYDLSTTDFVEINVYQNSGGALNMLSVANKSPEFMMQRVG